MTNNDIIRRVRYIFSLGDGQMLDMLALAGVQISSEKLLSWFKKEDEPGFSVLTDVELAGFLNGLIIVKRGPKADGEPHQNESELTNNQIFCKLKIACALKADDILKMIQLTGFTLSKHELSAIFRKEDHKHYRDCHDQLLRNFLKGLSMHIRDKVPLPELAPIKKR